MEINPDHIKKAETILIGGNEFNEERIKFINCLDTFDLLAVPGSGKTTALLAKLYCIAQQLPLENNAGILVLSHTNHAIEEIEKVLKPICPQLFSYPNFVGTIQSFANRFIANQACFELYGSYIRKNDDEMYFYEVEKFYRNLQWNKEPPALKNKIFGIVNRGLTGSFSEKENNVLEFLKSCTFDLEARKIKLGKTTKITYTGANQNYYVELENWKISLLSQGILSYKDSFDISKRYLNFYGVQHIKSILQHRFKFVFIDEMQDLDLDQVELIENIFFDEKSPTIIQRIGDKNQSIFSSKSLESETVWKTRSEINPEKYPLNFTLNNSYRLTPAIANLVDGFVLERDEGYKVIGISENQNIKPYLFVYNDDSDAEKLKNRFVDLIKFYELDKNSKNIEHGFHIIAWTTDKEEGSDKWHLRKLFPEYSKESKHKKEDFDCLRKYVFLYDHNKKTYESIRKSLLNGIIRILRIEQIYFEVDKRKHFRKSSLIQFLKDTDQNFYNDFKQRLFNWCYSIISLKNYEEVFTEYSNFIKNEIIGLFPDYKVSLSNNFVNQDFDFTVQNETIEEECKNDIHIKLGSIHSAKGQTHCATLYLETDYHTSETTKLTVEIVPGTKRKPAVFGNNPLFFQEQNFSHLNKARSNETLKMMYVGFSRPTHLLCFAVRKQNVQYDLERYVASGWIVESL
ncbi:UvrD-helicase domain-containing protein [Chryseobacterium sp.]|uniref:UvrD-helicase domain-containing protein n=1 Tax=Chryseobacterium sp. TaxID=1871047 RepID=UPI00289D5AB3|nr:UvrD-helicase domain-containing protein [Chryseobacterium sp.]